MDGHPPRAIVVMGVSGSGKSTLGAALAAGLGCAFLEGDDYHAPASVEKMRAGLPLDDADRWPWLDRLAAAGGDTALRDGVAVIACSALKRSYRDRLAEAAGVPLSFVLLGAAHGELARRMASRPHHYMPARLLDSQFATLEPLAPEERAIALDATLPPAELVASALAWIAAGPAGAV